MKLATKVLIPLIFSVGITILLFLYYWLVDYKTRIKLDGGEQPTFILSGSGRMTNFWILGPRQRPGNGQESVTVWELQPAGEPPEAGIVGVIGSIKYGSIPKGYKQVWPKNNVPPPALKTGETYICQIITYNAPWGQITFELHDGKAIEIPQK